VYSSFFHRFSLGHNQEVRCIGTVAQRLEQAAHNRLVAGSNPASPTVGESGYRIAAITRPCQGRNTGSTPVTRSKDQEVPLWDFLIFRERESNGQKRVFERRWIRENPSIRLCPGLRGAETAPRTELPLPAQKIKKSPCGTFCGREPKAG